DRVADQLEGYNRRLFKKGAELLPARLESVRQALPGTYFLLHATDEAYSKPPLKAFADADDRITLHTPSFIRYVEAKPAADARVRQILSFVPEAASPDKVDLVKKL